MILSITIHNDNDKTVMGAVLAMAYLIGNDPGAWAEAVKLEPKITQDPFIHKFKERARSMSSMKIVSGKLGGAMKICIYGPEGIGKSSLAAKFPAPLFIDTEGSTKFMDVRRFEQPSSWKMLLEQVKYARDNHALLRTLVVDTLDWAERLCIRSVCDQYQKSGIEAFDYGKGYVYVCEEFGKLLNLLTECTEKGITVIVTAHAATKRREQPDEFGTYDVWSLKLIDARNCSNANMVKEWADLVLFANYKTYVVATDDKGKKHKAQGGQRVMYTAHHPCWDAKNRLGLPPEMPLDHAALASFFVDSTPASGPQLASTPQTQPTTVEPAQTPPASSPAPQSETLAASASQDSADPRAPETLAKISPDVPAALRPLMEAADVTEQEVREVIAGRGYFPIDAPWSAMETAGFVTGWIQPCWDKIVETIRSNPDRVPF